VLAYNLARRAGEFGVRMALGASVVSIWRIVYGYVARVALVGVTAGTAMALIAGRMAESMLLNVPGYDTSVTALTVCLISAVALAAGSFPAWRASNISPAQAIRCE
jgi:ABC-type antimicrobial peptide transport system permease subunit